MGLIPNQVTKIPCAAQWDQKKSHSELEQSLWNKMAWFKVQLTICVLAWKSCLTTASLSFFISKISITIVFTFGGYHEKNHINEKIF